MQGHLKSKPNLDQLLSGIDQQNRVLLAQAITLVESKRPKDQELAAQLMDVLLPKTGRSIRLGITGVPGVGKSTFIEAFGKLLTREGKKVAVLSIDPSSALTRGSILGDKTRMPTLSVDPNAFIRPSPAGNSLGGVAHKTRETIMLCEAAGFEVVIVETVGVGQSETMVKDMVDFFLLLLLAGGGDELQGIKRGIMEMADALLINKADGINLKAAKQAKKAYENALHLFPPHVAEWTVPVQLCSALENTGIENIWQTLEDYRTLTTTNGFREENRKRQNLKWYRELVRIRLESDFRHNPLLKSKLQALEKEVEAGALSVRHAVDQLFA